MLSATDEAGGLHSGVALVPGVLKRLLFNTCISIPSSSRLQKVNRLELKDVKVSTYLYLNY